MVGATYQYRYKRGYPAAVNHEEETDFLIRNAQNVKEVQKVRICEPLMIGEDFAYYLQHVKGTFFLTGAMNPDWDEVYPHHHPRFNIDERSLLIAAKTLGIAAIEFLNQPAELKIEQVKS